MQLVLQEACGMSKDGCMWSRKDGGDLGDAMADKPDGHCIYLGLTLYLSMYQERV